MMIARWHIDAKFGHKSDVIDALKRWHEEIGTQIGWPLERVRILSGSVGAREATVVAEIEVEDLAALNDSWSRLAAIEAHKKWSRDLEPHMVSGSTYWEIYRVA